MPEDVKAALERFQKFLGQWSGSRVIDATSGFTTTDGFLIASEVQMLEYAQSEREDEGDPE